MTDERPLTLGERLDAQGRLMALRSLPRLPWASPLHVLLRHTTRLTAPFADRFARVETDPDAVVRQLPRTEGVPAPPPAPDMPGDPGPAGAAPPRNRGPAAGRPLPPDVRDRLREVAGDGADAMLVHDDETADAVARERRADAVTVGRDVYFRQGRFLPRERRGYALLAHEATHVLALLRPGADWRRATGAGAAAEEAEALTRERTALARPAAPRNGRTPARTVPADPPRVGPRPAAPAPPAPTPAVAARPMRAPQDRDIDQGRPAEPIDVDALRRGLLEDLMRRIRTDFERGG